MRTHAEQPAAAISLVACVRLWNACCQCHPPYTHITTNNLLPAPPTFPLHPRHAQTDLGKVLQHKIVRPARSTKPLTLPADFALHTAMRLRSDAPSEPQVQGAAGRGCAVHNHPQAACSFGGMLASSLQ